jgi:5-oxoprolinase (ATP-hydrolysing)
VNKPEVDLTNYDHVDPVLLSVYGHRLMGIAEQVRKIINVDLSI